MHGDGEDAERGHADRRSAEPEARRADGRRGRTKVKPRRDARRNWCEPEGDGMRVRECNASEADGDDRFLRTKIIC